MKKTKLNKKTILNFIALFLLAFNCSYAQLLKSLKDKINAMKPASDVAGIFQMTPDDVKKMQQDSASDILDKEFEKLKNEPDPLNINGVYYLKYPILVKSGSNQIFTKKVLILFRERKNRIYLLNSLTIGGGKDTLFIEEPGNGGQGLRSNKKFGSLCYNSSSQSYSTEHKIIGPRFIANGMNKYVFDKQTGDFKVAGLIEIDKGVFYLKAVLDYNSCDGKGTQSDEEQRSSLKKQENIFFNLLTKKENIQKMKDYDHNTITTKSCEKQAAFLEIYNKDEGGFTLPTPALSRKLPKYKPFKDKAIPALDQYLKSEGKSFKLLYAYSITRSEGFGDQKEKRFIGVTGVKQDVYIGRFTQFAVVAENLKPSTRREDNWNSKSKYAYFVVNIVEPVSDKSIDRLTPPNPNDYSGKYELMGTSSMPFFLNSEENTKVMQFKED